MVFIITIGFDNQFITLLGGLDYRKYGNTNALHPYKVDGTGQNPHHPVDRDRFDKDRAKYWRERGKAERNRRKQLAKGKC